MAVYEKNLTSEEWGSIYNATHISQIVKDLENNRLSFQSIEMKKLTKENDRVLEIGCGSGATSVYLAMNGRKCTALDFSKEALACCVGVAERCAVSVETALADATKDLPFEENFFDVVFQAGLLEHFDKDTRIHLLKIWGKAGKKMVSIIPNAASIAYRTGKALLEQSGKWEYGMELPQYSLRNEFYEAGFDVEEEYTIGASHALQFLPPKHYLRKALERWLKENPCEDDCGQGYLLVTIGKKTEKYHYVRDC